MPIPSSNLDTYIAFRRNADLFFINLISNDEFLDVITSLNPNRERMMTVLADAGIFPDDEQRRALIADRCMALAVSDQHGSTSWGKLSDLATALEMQAGPPWG